MKYKVNLLGNIYGRDIGTGFAGNVYGIEGSLAPTINTAQGGQRMPLILVLDEQNMYIRNDGCIGTLTTDGSTPKHNNRIVEVSYEDNSTECNSTKESS